MSLPTGTGKSVVPALAAAERAVADAAKRLQGKIDSADHDLREIERDRLDALPGSKMNLYVAAMTEALKGTNREGYGWGTVAYIVRTYSPVNPKEFADWVSHWSGSFSRALMVGAWNPSTPVESYDQQRLARHFEGLKRTPHPADQPQHFGRPDATRIVRF